MLHINYCDFCRDLATGTSLCSFRGNASPSRAAAILGRDYFVSCQLKKPILHFWSWRKVSFINSPEVLIEHLIVE